MSDAITLFSYEFKQGCDLVVNLKNGMPCSLALAHLSLCVYFVSQFRKAQQYSKGADQEGYCLFVSRVILGNLFIAEGPMKTHKRPPLVDGRDVPHDCVCHCRECMLLLQSSRLQNIKLLLGNEIVCEGKCRRMMMPHKGFVHL